MTYKTDIEIAHEASPLPVAEIAAQRGIDGRFLEQYGTDKAKLALPFLKEDRPDGKLILVTAITPTPAGEGKTTTTVGLADAPQAPHAFHQLLVEGKIHSMRLSNIDVYLGDGAKGASGSVLKVQKGGHIGVLACSSIAAPQLTTPISAPDGALDTRLNG